jgi:hypothetical protein
LRVNPARILRKSSLDHFKANPNIATTYGMMKNSNAC